MDNLGFLILVLLALVFILVTVGTYFYLAISTFRRHFANSSKIFPKVFFTASALLPVIIIIAMGWASNVQDNLGPCPSSALKILGLDAEYVTNFVLLLSFLSPLIFLLIGTILRFNAENAEKIIYSRVIKLLLLNIIIIISASLFFASFFNTARGKSIDASRKANLSALRVSMEVYFDDHHGYPMVTGTNAAERWEALKKILKNENITELPDDPCYKTTRNSDFQYDYRNSVDGLKYIGSVPLKNGAKYWCVDNSGASIGIDNIPDKAMSCR